MSAYRVFVANKIESEEVQKCFFELGYKWNGVGCVLKASEKFDFPYFVKGSKLGMSFIKRKSGDNSKELSLSELREYCDKIFDFNRKVEDEEEKALQGES